MLLFQAFKNVSVRTARVQSAFPPRDIPCWNMNCSSWPLSCWWIPGLCQFCAIGADVSGVFSTLFWQLKKLVPFFSSCFGKEHWQCTIFSIAGTIMMLVGTQDYLEDVGRAHVTTRLDDVGILVPSLSFTRKVAGCARFSKMTSYHPPLLCTHIVTDWRM